MSADETAVHVQADRTPPPALERALGALVWAGLADTGQDVRWFAAGDATEPERCSRCGEPLDGRAFSVGPDGARHVDCETVQADYHQHTLTCCGECGGEGFWRWDDDWPICDTCDGRGYMRPEVCARCGEPMGNMRRRWKRLGRPNWSPYELVEHWQAARRELSATVKRQGRP